MHHHVDSVVWDSIDKKWPGFASDPRNLRLGLSSDGFNHYKNLNTQYSMWPILLCIYNLPPNVCMSQENLMLTLLIPGKDEPGNDIDVYLEPLIDDLKELWSNGVEAHDAFTKSVFHLKAILMWTINDFSAYDNLTGCTTKGKLACPICGPNTCSRYLEKSHKTVYMSHRRFLPPSHLWCDKARWCDGTKEKGLPPRPLINNEILHAVSEV